MLEPADLIALARMVIIDGDSPLLEEVSNAVRLENGVAELKDCDFLDQQIRRAFVITAVNPNVADSAPAA